MTFQKKEEPLPIRGRRHHPERSSTLMRFPMRSYGYIHGHPHGHVHRHPHGYVHGHPHGDAHQIEGKQARRFMYMNRARSLPRPAALEQQPECRRPVEAASRAVRGGRAGGVQERHGGRPQGQRHVGLHRPRRAGLQPVNLIAVFAFQRLASVEQWHLAGQMLRFLRRLCLALLARAVAALPNRAAAHAEVLSCLTP